MTPASRGSEGFSWRTFLNHWSGATFLSVLAAASIWSMINIGPLVKKIQNTLSARSGNIISTAQSSPEEVLGYLANNLHAGNINAAVKLFTPDRQNHWLAVMNSAKTGGLLNDLYLQVDSIIKTGSKVTIKDNLATLKYKLNGKSGSVIFKNIDSIWRIDRFNP